MAYDIGPRIGIEGEKEFKNALKDVNTRLRTLGTEMKAVSSSFDRGDKSVSALTSKNQVLNKQIDEQKSKLGLLKAKLAESAAEYGENDAKTQKWQQAVNLATADLNKMERQLDNNNKELEETAKASDKAETETGQLGKELDETGNAAERSEGKFQKLGGALKGIGAAMGAVVVAAGAAAVKLGKEVINAYADYEQLVGGIETLFRDSSGQALEYANNAYKTAGLSANDYMETITGFAASLISSLDGDTEAAISKADMAITDMADNANKMGSTTESIQNAYQGFAKQNYTMLDNLKLGYGGTKSEMERLLADAEAISGIKYDISSYADVVDAIHVIQTEMGITGTTALEAEETITGSISALKASFGNLIAGLGDANANIEGLMLNLVDAFQTVVTNVMPILQNLVSALPIAFAALAPALGELLPTLLDAATGIFTQLLTTIVGLLPSLIPVAVSTVMTVVDAVIASLPLLVDAAVQLIVALVQGMGSALPQLIPAAVTAIITIVRGLLENLPLILDAGLQLVLGLVQGLLDALPQLIAALPAIITALVEFIIGSIPQIIDAGIQLLVSLISALPEIIKAVVEAIPQIVDGLVKAILGSIPLLIQAGVDLLVALIQNLPLIITTVVAAIPQIISSLITAIIGSIPQIIQAGVELLVSLIKNLPTIIVEVVKAVPQIIKALVDGFSGSIGEMVKVGTNLIKGLWQGISDAGEWLWQKISGFFGGVVSRIKDFFGIASPSKVFAEMGGFMAEGLSVGFKDEMKYVNREIQAAMPLVDLNGNISLSGVGAGGAVTNINISQLVVREEADINKIAKGLYRLQNRASRGVGIA